MGFPGRFSTGCHLCRRRKLKCDETRPSCRRCAVYGKPCPGYSDIFQFRYQRNPRPSLASLRSGSAPDKRSPKVAAVAIASDATEPDAHTYPATIPQALSLPEELDSLCYFINRFVCPPLDPAFPGYLNFIPGLYGGDGHGPFELATLGAARMIAYYRSGSQNIRRQSYSDYSAAVGQLRHSLERQDIALSDKTIGAVLLLCLFLDLAGDRLGQLATHLSGLYYLLKGRGCYQVSTSRSFELLLLALSFLHGNVAVTDDWAHADIGDISSDGNPSPIATPLIHAVSLVCKFTSLCRDLTTCPQGSTAYFQSRSIHYSRHLPRMSSDKESIWRKIQECSLLLHEFDEWDLYAATYWNSHFEGAAAPPSLGKANVGTRHYDGKTAKTIVLVRACRIQFSAALLKFCRSFKAVLQDGDIHPLVSIVDFKLEKEIALAISDIHYCMPYALGRLDDRGDAKGTDIDAAAGHAFAIRDSVKIIVNCSVVKEEQRLQSQRYLTMIGEIAGLRSPIQSNETR
ncbi:hypothetical protein F4859DRAFT_497973 [Xylaria cf. heliscus]|nr:hypothetical protein F4859DRAFT_497973 [Xylaria cf. heliscus]